jgi:capsule biosynthesis phosphatase
MLRIAVDLDGTICETKKEGQTYESVKPLPLAAITLRNLKLEGYYIVIYTARNMLTYNNNVGKIIAVQVPIITKWLQEHDIPYDELVVGKPNVDYFIDDKGITFTDWGDVYSTLKQKEINHV